MKKNKNKNSRNGMIELLRFLFCLGVLLFHGIKYLFGEPSLRGASLHFEPFIHGALGVEFFFLVSGLFMAQSISKELAKSKSTDLPKEEYNFLKKKVKSIFPQHVMAFIFIFVTLVITASLTLKESILTLVDAVPSFFLIYMSGIDVKSINGIEWYISIMLISMAILYPLAKKYYKNFVKIVCPIASLLILGALQKNYHSITGVMVWTGLFYKAFFRGIAEIMLGMFLYEVACSLTKEKLAKLKKVFLTGVELFCYLCCFIIIMFAFARKYEIYVVLLLCVGIPLSYSGITYTSIIKGKFFEYLGKLTLPMYLTQLGVIEIIKVNLYDLNHNLQLVILVIGSIILSMIFLVVENMIRDLIISRRVYEER